MKVTNRALFEKFLALILALFTIAPVLLFVPLPFWAHTLLTLAMSYYTFSWLLDALETDKKGKQ